MEHNSKSEPEASQSEASHPGSGQPPDLSCTLLTSCPLLLASLLPLLGLPGQDVSNLSLLQYERQLIVMEEVDHGVLGEHPHGEESQAGVLATESVVVCIECCVVQIEESQPVSPGHVGVATDGVILVTDPHYQDHIERRGGVLRESECYSV